ncbi:tRNA(Ile)-lysidine synthetase [hydrothermal vent metagenome]|uniref:tRNA(Ile)-lysidine synthetase n=1 Tax=hydrothermal vent metagenome TaxID=652676 RepID=A0A3B0WN03_9ZZZZ
MANTPNNHINHHLTAETLMQQLSDLAKKHTINAWCLAYSGGIDSQVLLHLLAQTPYKINAVYIDHGLQAESSTWAAHCEQQCQTLNISYQKINVNAKPVRGEGPEAAARHARYSALKTCVQADMGLLTAQHLDDQSETILLQLLRGAGAAGLAGMPQIAKFGKGWHARPLLGVSQESILAYAQQHQLIWVEDPSNQQVNYDRNYLRHEIVPNIKQRWSALNKTLSVFATQQAENAQLLAMLAEQDLALCLLGENCLDIIVLNKMLDARLRNVLRYWFKRSHYPMPSRVVLEQVVQQIKNTSHDSAVCVSWAKHEVRRFKDKLFCLKQLYHDATQVLNWNTREALLLVSVGKNLTLNNATTDDENVNFVLDAKRLTAQVSVRFRQGGEKIKPAGRNGHHDLKSLFQEVGVPVWQRERVPLLFVKNELVAVIGYWLADAYAIKGQGVLPECVSVCETEVIL